MNWVDNHIEVEPTKKPKKITGTRFAAILGMNPWSTPFESWCEITRTYEKPFEDNQYTIAGKTIEPKQADYMVKSYGMDNLITPTDVFGSDPFKKTFGDFFKDNSTFGGMWDYLLKGDNGKIESVLEMKTTKRVEDWQVDIPEYYALQAALYAYLLKCDEVIMVASILEDTDYANPDGYQPNASNTITRSFKISERYPNFQEYIDKALEWWQKHVVTGISPDYDDKKDSEILKVLKTKNITPETNIQELIQEGETLKKEIDEVTGSIATKEKRLKEIKTMIRDLAISKFGDNDKKVELTGDLYTWSVSKSETESIDKDLLKSDGLYDKYVVKEPTYRLSVK